jgi:hypothetical protein
VHSYLFCAYLFSADFRRGGRTAHCAVTYAELRQLHINCSKALHLKKNSKDPAHNTDIDTGLYSQYLKMQAGHAARITFLKEGHYEEPLITDADMCVPPLLHTFSGRGREGDSQPAGNYSPISSCAFGPARILAYEKASNSFKEDMQLQGPISIPKLRALIEYDIAHFHLRKLKWKPKRAAHLQGTIAADDDAPPRPPPTSTGDETEINFLDWNVTDISSIPWAALQFSATASDTIKDNDVPAHLLPGLLIDTHATLGQRTAARPRPDLRRI